jgi:hypothetical protein
MHIENLRSSIWKIGNSRDFIRTVRMRAVRMRRIKGLI